MEQKVELKVCRTCLKTATAREKMLSVHEISNFLMCYTSLKIAVNDGLPSNICSNCHKQANQAYDFKLLCEASDRKLRNSVSFTIKATDTTVHFENAKIKLESDSDSNTSLLSEEQPHLFEESTDIDTITLLENKITMKNEIYDEAPYSTEKPLCATESYINQIMIKNEENPNSENQTLKVVDKTKNKQLKCRFCDLTFIHRARLLKHEMKHERGIKCYICGKDYQTLKQLSNHISIHNRKGAHLCQTCGKQFTMPENLARHQRIHSGICPYKCKLCNKSFKQSNELKSHLITHTSEKTHLCNVCGNKYARQMSLQVHMRRLHSESSIIRPFHCDICGRTFKDKRDLSQHSTIHKGERKYVCKVCNKAFNRSSNLKVHERIHSGYRPFVCHVCNRAFIQKHVLNSHLRTHPNDVIYKSE